MADVRPFRAIRYDHSRFGGDLSDLIAPPYDVLNQADKDALLAKSDRNIVAIDLPHLPPKTLGPPQGYDRSAAILEAWLADGTLVREERPAMYVYHQSFTHEGRHYTRRKFLARVRLVPFSEGVILPHEQTFGGPKEDRLALTKATRCNVSPVFGLYTDPEDQIGRIFADTIAGPPDVTATLDGVDNRLWILTDPGTIEAVTGIMAPKRIFIADGHHRYGTALNYRQYVTEQEGPLSDDHPANFVMLVLGSMDDPGSLILPYNRVLVGPDASVARLTSAWSSGCNKAETDAAELVLFDGADQSEHPLIFTDRGKLAQLEPDRSEAWRSLDVAYLHRYLIEELAGGLDIAVRYVKSAADARALAKAESGVALLTRATRMDQLQAVSEGGELMPQKSTYFHPKLATGLTINPLS
ncbi:MAG: DUF1015 domain-containing protein [bacterium]|nr:DUF1015 domain-containing protein [bacterium]